MTPGTHDRTLPARTVAPRAVVLVALAALSLAQTACVATGPAAAKPPPAPPLERFCEDAQRLVTGAKPPVENVVHAGYDAFVQSKPQAQPLQTQQYLWYGDQARTRLQMISCKLKTADHVRAVYGDGQAGTEGSCDAVNRLTVERVYARLARTAKSRVRLPRERIVLDADQVRPTGEEWLKPFAMVRLESDGTLHVVSQALRTDWTDPRFAGRPERFRGTHYCHLIAPDYVERLALGGGVEAAPAR
jgi:hypothetical protein